MTTCNRPRAFVAGAVLFALTAQGNAAGASFAARPSGFLTPSTQLAPSAGGDKLSAGLPHLRLEIVLTEMEHFALAGNGVVSYGYPEASVKIASNAADASIPAPAAAPLEFPTPTSNHIWHLEQNATVYASINPLYVGIIENGCLGAPAMFDLTLDGTIAVPGGEVIGEVHLADSVFGPGYYDMEYTVRATDADGNVSDIVFRGHATSTCTSQQPGGLIATKRVEISDNSVIFQAMDGAAADSITCRPATSNWCANGFQIQCERQDGGLSTEPDGGITCTYPESEESGDTSGFEAAQLLQSPNFGLRLPSTTRTAAWVSLTCHGRRCDEFAQTCDKAGGGMSTEPDGGSTCTVQDNTCSGCD
jgi:hypothetical protein